MESTRAIRNHLFASILVLISICGFPQTMIYYTDNGNITMLDIASHYRVAKIDTALRIFVGEVKDYWANDSVMITMNYNSTGARDGQLSVYGPKGNLRLSGQYENGRKVGIWKMVGNKKVITIDFDSRKEKANQTIDSLDRFLAIKENFSVSQFIRRADYPDIYSLISRSRSGYDKDAAFNPVEEPPYFPNGMAALGKFISSYIKYPEEAVTNNVKGQVIVEFTITEDGSTTDFKIIESVGYGCDEEAIRVLKLLPDWIPGYQRGKPVRTKFKLPIKFGS